MNELEKKFSCLCGSEVKETNRKAHEKTKKHINYQQSHGSSNLVPVHNLPTPKPARKRKYSEVEDAELEEDDYDDQEQGDDIEDGDDGFEEELLQAIESIHQSVEHLVADKMLIRKDMMANLHKTVTDVGFLLNPLLNSINDRLKCIEDRLNSSSPAVVEPQKWINDKCTQRNA